MKQTERRTNHILTPYITEITITKPELLEKSKTVNQIWFSKGSGKGTLIVVVCAGKLERFSHWLTEALSKFY